MRGASSSRCSPANRSVVEHDGDLDLFAATPERLRGVVERHAARDQALERPRIRSFAGLRCVRFARRPTELIGMARVECSSLAVAVHRVGHRAVIEATGDIDIVGGAVFAAAAEDVVRSGALEVWVDLGPTRFMDSSGLHTVLWLRRRLGELRRRLAIICPRGPVRRVFEITGLDRELVIHPTLAAAQRQA